MSKQLFEDFKKVLFEDLNERGLLDPKEAPDLHFGKKIQEKLGFQRMFFSDDKSILNLSCEKTTLASVLYSRLSIDGAEQLLKRGWAIRTDFEIKGTGKPPVWPKHSRLLAHTKLENEQKTSGRYTHTLPPATKKFLDFWIGACRNGGIHRYSDNDEFAQLINKIKTLGIIDEADYEDLQAVIARGKANGSTYTDGLNPVPLFLLTFQLPALASTQDVKSAAGLVLEEIRFVFETLGLLDEYEDREMNPVKESKSRSNELAAECKKLLIDYKEQIILQGPPGTGKTHLAKDVAELLLRDTISPKEDQNEFLDTCPEYKIVQFHPSYTYEDFVRGIEVKTDGSGTARYEPVDRVLARFAEVASNKQTKRHVLIIDEINRANLSAVLGELIYALEYRGQAVESMYGIKVPGSSEETDSSENERYDHQLMLPDNLYIIGTMNTADRSASHLDYAIRRRFAFIEVLPELLSQEGFDAELFKRVRALFSVDGKYSERSTYLSEEFRPRDVAIGHSYFIGLLGDESRKLRIEYEIKPILFEYLKDGVLKESAREIIEELA